MNRNLIKYRFNHKRLTLTYYAIWETIAMLAIIKLDRIDRKIIDTLTVSP